MLDDRVVLLELKFPVGVRREVVSYVLLAVHELARFVEPAKWSYRGGRAGAKLILENFPQAA
jgi:hypothetical protein